MKIKILIASLLVGALLAITNASNAAERRAETFADIYEASCRVTVSGARGTGLIVGINDETEKYIVVTNYHVVTTSKSATCEFWNGGRILKTTGNITWRYHDQNMPADFAFIEIDRNFVETNDLPFVPLAGSNVSIDAGKLFDSSGCPKGMKTGAWKGVVLSVNQTIEFQPHPIPGQSGSGIVAYFDGEPWYIGTLTWLVGTENDDSSRGAFIPVANLYRALSGRSRTANGDRFVAPPNYQEVPYLGLFNASRNEGERQ